MKRLGSPRSRRVFLVLAISGALAAFVSMGMARPKETRAASNPFAANAIAPADQFVFEGEVEERLVAGPYVYQRVAGRWVVSMAITTPEGRGRVRVTAVGHADAFDSPRLGRRFDHLIFGMVRLTN